MAPQEQQQVIVWEGKKAIAVLPDREQDLGEVRQDQMIITSGKMRPSGPMLDVFVVDKDHPMALELKRRKQPHSGD